MNEKLMTEIFSEKQEVPIELKKRIHEELIKQERVIMIKNTAFSLGAIFLISLLTISFAVIFLGDIIALVSSVVFSIISAFMATALAVVAAKYEIGNIRKGIL